MKETGIIMSGNHPKLIIDGLKTQTRRVIKPQPEPCNHLEVFGAKDSQSQKPTEFYEIYPGEWCCKVCGKGSKAISEFDMQGIKCPYGQVGDQLWVRETHIFEIDEDASPNAHYNEDEDLYLIPRYKADGEDISDWSDFESGEIGGKWRPSIFMPRWASRITLEITGLRAERVQKITKEDAKAEGIKKHISTFAGMSEERNPIYSFHLLWDSLNAKRGYGWDPNPWVWVIEFNAVGIRSK